MEFEGSIRFSILEQTKDKVVGEMPIRTGIKNPYGIVRTSVFGEGDKLIADVTTNHVLAK